MSNLLAISIHINRENGGGGNIDYITILLQMPPVTLIRREVSPFWNIQMFFQCSSSQSVVNDMYKYKGPEWLVLSKIKGGRCKCMRTGKCPVVLGEEGGE